MSEKNKRRLYGTVDNLDETGKPAGALGPTGAVMTVNRYRKLRGKLLDALRGAYGKFSAEYFLEYRSKPTYARVRECAVGAFNDFLAEVPQVEPATLPEMLDSV